MSVVLIRALCVKIKMIWLGLKKLYLLSGSLPSFRGQKMSCAHLVTSDRKRVIPRSPRMWSRQRADPRREEVCGASTLAAASRRLH